MILFIIFLLIFFLLVIIQIYYYKKKSDKNELLLKNIEAFESKLKNIDKKDILLEDTSIEHIIEQYNEIKNNNLK
jgi:hypothetical protein